MPARKTRLGWLGPAIVIAGLVIGAIGVWIMITNKPAAGAVIDTIAIDPATTIVIRAEDGGPRSFVELVRDGEVAWQAMVPPYAGAKGTVAVAWSDVAISVRVVRDHKAELFALARANGSKLGGVHLGLDRGRVEVPAPAPITVTDHLRSYEIVAGDGWNQVVAVDLKLGTALWKHELGATRITAGAVEGGQLWLQQGDTRRWFNVFTGKEDRSTNKHGKPWEKNPQTAPAWPADALQRGSSTID